MFCNFTASQNLWHSSQYQNEYETRCLIYNFQSIDFFGYYSNILQTPPGKLTILHNGYTYSYEDRTPNAKKGQKGPCCRPTRMQCTKSVDSSGIEVNKCRKKTGSTRCGTGCTGIKTALENLQKLEEKREAKRRKAERREAEKRKAGERKAEKRKDGERKAEERKAEERKAEERKAERRKAEIREAEEREAEEREAKERKAEKWKEGVERKAEESESRSGGGGGGGFRSSAKKSKLKAEEEHFDEYSNEEFDEYSNESEYSDEEESQEKKGGGGVKMGLRVIKGQKVSHKQLDLLESASKKWLTSKNPLCKKKANIFRCLSHSEKHQLSIQEDLS